MIPDPTNLGRLTATHISSLVDNGVAESSRLEFKSAPHEDTREFCKDVSAMANSGGGCIVYGIAESDGVAVAIDGVTDPIDAMKRRLGEAAQDSIRPRMQLQWIELVVGDHTVVVLAVNGQNSPHQIVANKSFRFHKRVDSMTALMDVEELRTMFLERNSPLQRAKKKHFDHVSDVINETPVGQDFTRKAFLAVLDAIPHSDLGEQFDPVSDGSTLINATSIAGGLSDRRISFDGFVFQRNKDPWIDMVRVRRDGEIHTHSWIDNDDRRIPHKWIEDNLAHAVGSFSRVYASMIPDVPYSCWLTLCGIKRWQLTIARSREIDLDQLRFPPLVFDHASPEDSEQQVELWLQRLWNAGDCQRPEARSK